jgi:hypothetical protein
MRYLFSAALGACAAVAGGWIVYRAGVITWPEYVMAAAWGVSGASVGYAAVVVSFYVGNKIRRRRHKRRLMAMSEFG